jgi:hypothetical protein
MVLPRSKSSSVARRQLPSGPAPIGYAITDAGPRELERDESFPSVEFRLVCDAYRFGDQLVFSGYPVQFVAGANVGNLTAEISYLPRALSPTVGFQLIAQ